VVDQKNREADERREDDAFDGETPAMREEGG
jgi:hypothetical protein